MSQPVSFETAARVWVQPKLAEMVPSSYQTSLYAPLTAFFNSPIATAGEVLRSNIVLEQALSVLQQQLPPSDCPTLGDLRNGLTVAAAPNADILQLRFRYKEPKMCQMALDSLLTAFIKVNSEQSSSSATQSRIFLERQLKKAREDSLKARESLRKFQDENGTLDFSEQSGSTLKMLSDIEDSLRKTQTVVMELQAKIGFLQGQLKMRPEDAVLAQRLAIDDVVRQLQATIGLNEVRMIEYRAKFREEHPRLQQVKILLEQSRQALRDRVSQLIGPDGYTRANLGRLYGTDPMQQKLLGDMVNSKADLLAAETKIASLHQQEAAIKKSLAQLPAEQQRLTELNRSAEVAKNILSDTERNLHSIKLLEAVASRASNIQILDRPGQATPTEQKSLFSIAVSALMGILLGALTFYGIYLLNPAVHRIKDVLNLIPLPIVGWVNRLPAPVNQKEVLPGLEHLRVNLRPWVARGHCRIVVTSGDAEDGKTVLASGLAVSLAKSGLKVILVDINFVHPSLHEVFELPLSPGLSEYLASNDPNMIGNVVHSVRDNFSVITAGKQEAYSGTIENRPFQELLAKLQASADVLVIDSAAASESADAFALLGRRVHLLLVVRPGHTYRNSLKLVAGQLRHQECANAGLVFFDVDEQSIISALSSESGPTEELPETEALTAESSHW